MKKPNMFNVMFRVFILIIFASIINLNPAIADNVSFISLNTYPQAIFINDKTSKIYLISIPSTLDETNFSKVTVLDSTTNKVINTIQLDFPKQDLLSVSGAISVITNKLFVSNGNKLITLDLETDKVINTMTLPSVCTGLTINPTNNKIWITNGSDLLSIINDSTSNSIANIKISELASSPGISNSDDALSLTTGIIFNSKTNNLYLTKKDHILVIDPDSNKITNKIFINNYLNSGEKSTKVAINENTNRLYISTEKSIIVVDLTEEVVLDKISLENSTRDKSPGNLANLLAVNPNSNEIFATNTNNLILVIDGTSHKIIDGTIVDKPTLIAVDTSSNKGYIGGIFFYFISNNGTPYLQVVERSTSSNNNSSFTFNNRISNLLNDVTSSRDKIINDPSIKKNRSIKRFINPVSQYLKYFNSLPDLSTTKCTKLIDGLYFPHSTGLSFFSTKGHCLLSENIPSYCFSISNIDDLRPLISTAIFSDINENGIPDLCDK